MPRGRPGITPRLKKSNPKAVLNLAGHIPGPGRPKGSRNKVSGEVKGLILLALANAHPTGDEVDYLIEQARVANPSPFMSLVGKCVVQEQHTELDGTININVTYDD
jgi:hypothetical protein